MTGTANILGLDNGGGLSRDIDVLATALKDLGWVVVVNGRAKRSPRPASLARELGRMRRKAVKVAIAAGVASPPFDLNLHLEEINGPYLVLARQNVLIPNQEWFRNWCFPSLPRIDQVWAKTRAAERIFSGLGCRVRFLGWTAVDRGARSACAKRLTALHIAGASITKGTEAVLDVWSHHPEWPMLRVLRRTRGYSGEVLRWRDRAPAPNVQIISKRLDERALIALQNESALHLCPSEAEGFGHNILEAMSVGAVVLATDAPPMNEMVTSETGLLVPADRSEPLRLGRRYFVNREALAERIRAALDMSDEERASLGRAARDRFEENNVTFRGRLRHYLELTAGTASEAAEPLSPAESSLTQTPVD